MDRIRRVTVLQFSPVTEPWYAVIGHTDQPDYGTPETIVGWAVLRDEDARTTYVAPMSLSGDGGAHSAGARLRDPRDEPEFVGLVQGSTPNDLVKVNPRFARWMKARTERKHPSDCKCLSWHSEYCAAQRGSWGGFLDGCGCECHFGEHPPPGLSVVK